MINRRRFLNISGRTMLGAGLASLLPRQLVAADNGFSDYKCLVNIFLYGGNDSFNLVVPTSNAEYNVYAASRQNLAVEQLDLLAINPDNADGATYGFHPSAGALQSLFEAGDAAVIANVGPLIAPVTKEQYLSGAASLPPQLFSHNDQQAQWQSLKGDASLATGWAGRIADQLVAETADQLLALNTSTFGTNLFQAGAVSIPYSVSTTGANTYGAFGAEAALGAERRAAFESHIDSEFGNVHARALAAVHKRSLASADLVNQALAQAPDLATVFPASFLGAQLNIIARLIAVRDRFEMSRQIFFVGAGGFDTHDDQNELQPGLLSDVADSIQAFQLAMVELGVNDNVVSFTHSDFGRTLTSNGDGTDHGWGGHQIVTGGPVNGRQIYGQMPILEIGGDDDATGGRIIPTTSVDQYAGTLAEWFGVDTSALDTIAPSLSNFTTSNLGFV